jgi:hypothetical protein
LKTKVDLTNKVQKLILIREWYDQLCEDFKKNSTIEEEIVVMSWKYPRRGPVQPLLIQMLEYANL